MKKQFSKFLVIPSVCLTLFLCSCTKDDDNTGINEGQYPLKNIEVYTPPTKIYYAKDEKLNLSGLKLLVTLERAIIDSTLIVSYVELEDFGITCSPDSGTTLATVGAMEISITHEQTGIETTQDITVYNTITDADNNTYKIVEIGTQEWLAENLRATKFNDNTIIQLVEDAAEWDTITTPAYCWYNNDVDYATENNYGALYNFQVVNTNKLCPTGWHVATEDDWLTLFDYVSEDGHQSEESKSLKAAEVWDWVVKNGTDNYGFALFPSGYRTSDGIYYGAGSELSGATAAHWAMSEQYIFFDRMKDGIPYVYPISDFYNKGKSVRCVKD